MASPSTTQLGEEMEIELAENKSLPTSECNLATRVVPKDSSDRALLVSAERAAMHEDEMGEALLGTPPALTPTEVNQATSANSESPAASPTTRVPPVDSRSALGPPKRRRARSEVCTAEDDARTPGQAAWCAQPDRWESKHSDEKLTPLQSGHKRRQLAAIERASLPVVPTSQSARIG
eukprot:gene24630-29959_t